MHGLTDFIGAGHGTMAPFRTGHSLFLPSASETHAAPPFSIPWSTGLPTQLLVEVIGLGSRGSPEEDPPHFSHAVLRRLPEGTKLGQVPLAPKGPAERGLLSASLPPALLSAPGAFALELVGQDGGGQSLHRAAPQPSSVAPVLLEVRGAAAREGGAVRGGGQTELWLNRGRRGLDGPSPDPDRPVPAAQRPPGFLDPGQQGRAQPPCRQLLRLPRCGAQDVCAP